MNKIKCLKILPTKKELSHDLISLKISVAGKIFHILFSGGNKSLEKTSKGYLEKTNTSVNVDNDSIIAIENIKKAGRGIIISNHKSGVFSDYLPLFATLGDDILKKCIFYTGSHNLTMNEREFSEYKFRSATLRTKKDVIGLKKQIVEDVAKINQTGGYIFIIPSGANTSENAEFKSIFQRMIKLSQDNLPILVNHIEHDSDKGYENILKSIMNGEKSETTLTSKFQLVSDWKDQAGKVLKGDKMREKYNKDVGF